MRDPAPPSRTSNQASILAEKRLEAIRAWLIDHPEIIDTPRMHAPTRDFLRAFMAGSSIDELAQADGRSRHVTMTKLREFAKYLGYVETLDRHWLRSDGSLNLDAVQVDPDTGCQLWLGAEPPFNGGPVGNLPIGHLGASARHRQSVNLRRFLYEQAHGKVRADHVVIATCGNRRCLALTHAEPVCKYDRPPQDLVASLVDRAAIETIADAMARTGLTRQQVRRYRPADGKPDPPIQRPSAVGDRLTLLMPPTRPEQITELVWTTAQRFVAGESIRAIAEDHGVSRQMVHARLTQAVKLLERVTDEASPSH